MRFPLRLKIATAAFTSQAANHLLLSCDPLDAQVSMVQLGPPALTASMARPELMATPVQTVSGDDHRGYIYVSYSYIAGCVP